MYGNKNNILESDGNKEKNFISEAPSGFEPQVPAQQTGPSTIRPQFCSEFRMPKEGVIPEN